MSTHDRDIQVMFLRQLNAESGRSRVTLVISLLAILSLLGSLALTIAATPVEKASATNTPARPRVQSHAHKPPTPRRAVTSSSRQKSASTPFPVTPFPSYLWQEIALLQSHHRFLFNGNPHLPEIALTFDDGPNPYYTPQILTILQQYGIKATFFCIGRQVAAYPDLVREEYAAGNVVGNHSWSHPDMALLSSDTIAAQINRTSDIIQQTIGVRPTFFRPPYGVFNPKVLTQTNFLGLTTVIWNDEARDWLRPGVAVINSHILGLAGDGAIILLHDGGGNRSQTVAALPTIITTLHLQGYRFVTIQQMINDLP